MRSIVVSILVASALALGLSACGRTELDPPDDPDAGDAATVQNTMELTTEALRPMAPCESGKKRCADNTCIDVTAACPAAVLAPRDR